MGASGSSNAHAPQDALRQHGLRLPEACPPERVARLYPGDCSTTEAALPCGLRCGLPRMVGIASLEHQQLRNNSLPAKLKLLLSNCGNCCMATLVHIAKKQRVFAGGATCSL